ncbi:MAG TPA: response regulator [Rhodocyclaceae bacterium]|nr:response regulator [Rhodocyclaceae bacterium]
MMTGPILNRPSVRSFLIYLLLACLLPGVVGAVTLLILDYREGRDEISKDTLQTARALSQAVDNKILKAQALAQGLASADALAEGDFPKFYRQARRTLEQTGLPGTVSLADPAGQQIINTLRDFGQPLPPHGSPELIRTIFDTGRPAVSDLYSGRVRGSPIVSVGVPVTVSGKVAYALTISILPEEFNGILLAQRQPADRVSVILDSTGTVVTRTRGEAERIGRKASPGLLKRLGESDEGFFENVTTDGEPVVSVYRRSPMTGWSVAIGISREKLGAALTRTLSLLALGVAGLFAVGLALAWFVGAKISRSIRALVAPALSLGAGEPVALPSVEVKEAAEVAAAMGEAGRLLAERTAALNEREIQLSLFIEGAPAAIAMFDTDMRYMAASRRLIADYGLPWEPHELVGKSHYEVFPEICQRWRDIHARVLAGKTQGCDADPFPRKDGRTDWVRWRMEPWLTADGEIGGCLLFAENITALKEAQTALAELNASLERQVQERTTQLAQAQKMEAIGRLTGGVAHDFNNILQALASCLYVVERRLPAGTPPRVIDSAMQAIDSGAKLTKAMLAFAGRQALVPEAVDLDRLFDEIGPIIERTLGGRICVVFEVHPGTPAALADRAQVESALLNLAINARDAMPTGGLLTLRATRAVVRRGEASHPPELAVGTYVAISVQDTGTGMDPATLSRVFEPFFTTKEIGKGTGLGLSMVHGMAAQSGGAVAIASAPGCGTEVTLYLPSAAAQADEALRADEELPPGDGSTVLLVDDNPLVRDALKATIEALGYRVVDAGSGAAALAALEAAEGIAALVTDYAMPGMNGAELIQQIRRRAADVPVLLITGYAERPDVPEGVMVLQKPFQPEDLAARLAEILAGEPASGAGLPSPVLAELPA